MLRRLLPVLALATCALPALGAPPASPSPPAGQECPMQHRPGMHGMQGMEGGGPGGPFMRAIEDLKLTPEQREAMKAVGERFSARGTELRQRGEAIAEAMRVAEPGTPGYASATDKAGADAAGLAADTVRLAADLRSELWAILTPEQREQLRQRTAQQRKGWDEWRERHRPAQ